MTFVSGDHDVTLPRAAEGTSDVRIPVPKISGTSGCNGSSEGSSRLCSRNMFVPRPPRRASTTWRGRYARRTSWCSRSTKIVSPCVGNWRSRARRLIRVSTRSRIGIRLENSNATSVLPQELPDDDLDPLFLAVDREIHAAHGGVIEDSRQRIDRGAALRIDVVSINDRGVV